jgi:hypothetical protein
MPNLLASPGVVYQPPLERISSLVVADDGHPYDLYYDGGWIWEDQERPPGTGATATNSPSGTGRMPAVRTPEAGHNLSLLLTSQLWRSPANAPFPASGLQADFSAFPQHRPFKFGERPDHMHHHASGRCAGIDLLGQTSKSRFGLRQSLDNSQHIPQ